MPLPPPAADRTALVTGASSGIGVELARQLAHRGHGVTLVARREEPMHRLAAELRRDGVRAEVLAADLAEPGARADLVARVGALGLHVGILVNNAGLGTSGPVHGSDPGREASLVRTNVEAVADLCSRLVPEMVRRGSGAVLNVASTAAFQPLPGQAAYAASKAFVLSYSRALRAELDATGVSVTALCPGPVATEFGRVAGFSAEETAGALPRFMWVPAPAVAAAGVDGLAAGRAVVIPGAANRVTAHLAALTPRRVLLPFLARSHPALKR